MKAMEELIKEIKEDFERRKEERSKLEQAWLLNINFLTGNQHAELTPNGDIYDPGKQYHWQQREVFNHIAPIMETRMAKFGKLKCALTARAATSDASDINAAKFATALIRSVKEENNFDEVMANAVFWSEVTGTSFYKAVWNKEKGKKAGVKECMPVYEGEAEITACPPYEIYPDNINARGIEECRSIIHAKAYSVKLIEDIWGVRLKGREISVINTDLTAASGGGYGYGAHSVRIASQSKEGRELVIERYSLPDKDNPQGRLTVIAGDSLLYDGELPYEDLRGKKVLPFIRQVSINQPYGFFGASIIERLIPVQRAYNFVKNRKHEYMNRLALGVMAVEEGSVDLDNLEEEGLPPGKVLIYRQGSAPPFMLSAGSVPPEFRDEEDRLLAEFINISGVSDFLSSSNIITSNLSGVTLQMLIEQDEIRLNVSAREIRNAVRETGRHILWLYRKFATAKRLKQISGEDGERERLSFCGSDISGDDIVFETENELSDSPAGRRSMIMEILKLGLLHDENGKLKETAKLKILETLGFGNWQSARSCDELHIKKAAEENEEFSKGGKREVDENDDHALHIGEHVKRLISKEGGRLDEKQSKALGEHIRKHKQFRRLLEEARRLSQNADLT